MDGIAQPRQQRSRESFARVRAATLSLMAEHGAAGVTIADVSERAGVSVGTIYGRVGNRANLLRTVQEEELARIQASMVATLAALEADGAATVESIVDAYVQGMASSAPTLRSLVQLAAAQQELDAAGPAAWREMREVIMGSLERASDVVVAPSSDSWRSWVYEVLDAATFQYLESSTPQSAAGQRRLVKNLIRTARLLLEAGEGPVGASE
ncbi:TetR/AcrR family transcriptional regulator [Pseudoclavibacter sp. JAI123]|uniref:TetR/AcrR family transcriptional regulator n=1 Tax=Pseudoclavibacter sp. JAI123 TaxID=2723065 RepID=UPI00211BC85A|nr:TetR/AcrR family transcriptional regulator [Pseudoclavibacter sp. JAI123]